MLSKTSTGALHSCLGTHRIDIEDGDDDWTTLSLEKAVCFLIEESPNFKLLMEDALRRAGAHHNFFLGTSSPAMTTAQLSGDNRLHVVLLASWVATLQMQSIRQVQS